jgi:hypothetical protein
MNYTTLAVAGQNMVEKPAFVVSILYHLLRMGGRVCRVLPEIGANWVFDIIVN